ncbi:hypothetical protein G7Y89_g3641 [Cudoniella acicularis]|uniref:Uncharacterized protein n=1 Tax=Cudoniella acicularis TaxID=354080 RepID=A0A8H4W5E8_9HELO|nr:hypothetical protein G7Y89_g3641 [Cudoniella acicularis]
MAQISNPHIIPATLQSKQYEPVEMPPLDPAIDLDFKLPSAQHSFTELGLSKPSTAPDICFSEPFQLFSEEGVRMIRRYLFRPEVLEKHFRAWERAPGIISGAEQTALWTRDMWHHPSVTKCMSEAFGHPLKLLGRLGEVGYVNVQIGPSGRDGVYSLQETPSLPLPFSETPSTSQNDDKMIDSWYRDSSQVVCIVMLSDTSTMVGGKTAIRLNDGTVLKARGGRAGSAVMMQGGHTVHAALRSSNAAERVSIVTSYSFVNPSLGDSATSLRSISAENPDVISIREHFLLHKLGKLRERVDKAILEIEAGRKQRGHPREIKREEVEPWVEEQISLLKQTAWELFERYPTYLYKEIPEGAIRDYLPSV